MSDEQNTVLATSLNPRPQTSRKICEACTQPTLGPLMQCQNGSVLNNWARCIPENVAIRFTLKKSAEEVGTSLLCDVSCLTNKNERRRANKECTRTIPKCAGCCRGAGGCNTPSHRVKHRDVPLSLLAERQPSSTQTSADPGSSASITEDTNVIRHTFARPLDEGYAKNYISRHRQLLDANTKMEATQKLKDLTTNSVHVNYPPQHFKLVNSQPGKFVPQEHTVIMAAAELETGGFIQHLAAVYPSPLWVVHDARVGIPVIGPSSSARILLRKVSLSDDDCLGLNAEISLIPLIPIDEHPHPLGAIAQARRLLALSSSSTRNSSPDPPSSSKSSPAPPESAEDERKIRPLPFPFQYARDMEPGMHALSALRKSTQRLGLSALESGFRAQPSFKNCRFKGQTVYKHLRIYNEAVAANLSLSGETKWSNIVKQVDALKTAITEPTALTKTDPVVIDIIDDDDGVGFDVKNLKLERYRCSDGILETYSPPGSYMDVIVLDQYAAGKRMHVHMAQYSANGNLQTVALKKIVIPGPWFDLWHNKSVATWVEGARLAECGILWLAFASRVRAVDIDLVGFITQEGYRVFDSRTHALAAIPDEHNDDTLRHPFLQSLDAEGIKDFTDNHTCNTVCRALELNSIPLIFPRDPN
ncbi:hypothetical protein C8J57DRAFT_1485780 [Mycena rebaudengoi]|nr:hypothetical protein C8J57DRAFT_1485780 [Mycena rebaudengoi]